MNNFFFLILKENVPSSVCTKLKHAWIVQQNTDLKHTRRSISAQPQASTGLRRPGTTWAAPVFWRWITASDCWLGTVSRLSALLTHHWTPALQRGSSFLSFSVDRFSYTFEVWDGKFDLFGCGYLIHIFWMQKTKNKQSALRCLRRGNVCLRMHSFYFWITGHVILLSWWKCLHDIYCFLISPLFFLQNYPAQCLILSSWWHCCFIIKIVGLQRYNSVLEVNCTAPSIHPSHWIQVFQSLP